MALLPGLVVRSQPGTTTPPPGYYDDTRGLSGAALHGALHRILRSRHRPIEDYDDTFTLAAVAHQAPGQAGMLLTVYSNRLLRVVDNSRTGWEREHAWPQSYGFPTQSPLRGVRGDAHNIFPEVNGINQSRSNKPYDTCHGTCTPVAASGHPGTPNRTKPGVWEVWPQRRGDVARAVMYMDVRYDGGVNVQGTPEPDLILTDDERQIVASPLTATIGHMGILRTLVAWHLQDLPDDREQWANQAVFNNQGTRNPFVDTPAWVCSVWQGKACWSVWLPMAANP